MTLELRLIAIYTKSTTSKTFTFHVILIKNIKQYTNYFNSMYEKVELIYFRHLFITGL